MARTNRCKTCGKSDGPWVGTNHNLCTLCIERAKRKREEIVFFQSDGVLKWGRYRRGTTRYLRDKAQRDLNPQPSSLQAVSPFRAAMVAAAVAGFIR